MKVIKGNFNKGSEEDDTYSTKRVMEMLTIIANDILPEGGFDEAVIILNRTDGEGTTYITNTDLFRMNFLLDFAKNVVMNGEYYSE